MDMAKRALTLLVFLALLVAIIFYAQPYCVQQGMLSHGGHCTCVGAEIVVSDHEKVATDSEPYRTRCLGIITVPAGH